MMYLIVVILSLGGWAGVPVLRVVAQAHFDCSPPEHLLDGCIGPIYDMCGDMKEQDAKLMTASLYGCNILVKDLLDDGASVHAVTTDNQTALIYAALGVSGAHSNQETPLETSMRVDVVETLVKAGADVNWLGGRRTHGSPLMEAASVYNASGSDVVEALLRCGAGPDFPDSHGKTALMYAIERHETFHYNCGDGNPYNPWSRPLTTDIEEALLKAGADVNLEDEWGETALLTAARVWSSKTTGKRFVQALLTAGAEVQTALLEAATNCNQEGAISIMEALLKAGAEVDQQDSRRKTALMHASQHGNLKNVQFLVETAGANAAIKDLAGYTASDLATNYGYEAVATYLHEHPPSFSQKVVEVWRDTVYTVWHNIVPVLLVTSCFLLCAVWTIAINRRYGEREPLMESEPAPE